MKTIRGRKILYQFGEGINAILFRGENQKTSIRKSVKTKFIDSPFTDGNIDLSGVKPNFLEQRTIEIDNLVSARGYSLNHLNKNLYSAGIQKIYFYEITEDDDIKFYWNYGRVVAGNDDENSAKDGLGQEEMISPISLALEYPYYFEADDLTILDYSVLASTNPARSWGDPNITYGQTGVVYGKVATGYEKLLSNLTLEQKKTYFIDNLGQPKFVVQTTDYFIKPDLFEPTFITKLLNSNTTYSVLSSEVSLDLKTTKESFINLVRFNRGSGDCFVAGDYVEIWNEKTNSGFKFEFLRPTGSGNKLFINLHKGIVYDANYFILKPTIDYKLTILDGREKFLSFSPLFLDREFADTGLPATQTEYFMVKRQTTNAINFSIKNLKIFI